MRITMLIVAGLFLSLQGLAQYALEGRVVNQDNEPLAGASVAVIGTYLGTSAGPDGGFAFNRLKEKTLTLKVSYIGYQQKTKEVQAGTESLTIKLQPKDVLTDEIIVQATRAGDRDPMAKSEIDRETLEQQNVSKDIPYLLNLTPSVVATSEAGAGIGYTHMRVRGSDPTRINVTINGIPLNDSESQGVFWVDVPDLAASVNNVQIQRGVGTSTNGAGAFGATINFQTFERSDKPYAELSSFAGSFNTFKNRVQAGTGLIDDKFSINARYSNVTSDGYIDHSGSNHEALFLSGAWYGDNTLIKGHVFTGRERSGISWWGVPEAKLETDRTYNPAGQYTDFYGNPQYYGDQTDNYEQTHYQLKAAHTFSERLNGNIALHYTKGQGYFEQYKAGEAYTDYGLAPIQLNDTTYSANGVTKVFPDSAIHNTDLIRRKYLDNDFYGLTYALNYKAGRLKLTLGGAVNSYRGGHFGDILWAQYGGPFTKDYRWYDNTGRKDDGNVFLKANWNITQALSIYGDMQYRYIYYELQGPDDDLVILDQNHTYHFLNPKFGLHYRPSVNQEMYASVAVAHREPTRTDFTDAKGDEAAIPQSEELIDYEMGYQWQSSSWAAKLNLFYMDYNNQLVPTGEKSNVGNDIMTNVKSSYRRGIELTARLKPFPWLSWSGNATFSQNRIENFVSYAEHYKVSESAYVYEGNKPTEMGETHLAYSPEITGASTFSLQFNERWNVALSSKYVGGQYFDNTSSPDRKLAPYFVNNLKASYTFAPGKLENLRFRLAINNLFDVQYESSAYGGHWYENDTERTWAYYYPQAGIHFMAGLDIRL